MATMKQKRTWLHGFFWLVLGLPGALAAGSGEPHTAPAAPPAAAAPQATRCPPGPPVLTPEAVAAAARHAPDRGLLWRVGKDGRDGWLYGTLHVAEPQWVVLGPAVQQALRASDVLALELDPRDVASLRALLAHDARAGAAVLTPARQRRLAAQAQALCASAETLSAQRPGLRALTLLLRAGRHAGLHAEFAIDHVLAVMAQRLDKPIVALETAHEQVAALFGDDARTEGETVDALLDALESGRATTEMRQLADAWARGDLARLERYPEWCQCMDTEPDRARMARLLAVRNAPMAERFAALHAQGQRPFLAVGALHMVGPQGLPALLRARGFSVQHVPNGQALAPPRPPAP